MGLVALGDSPGGITPAAGSRGGSASSALRPRWEGASGSWSLLAVLPSPPPRCWGIPEGWLWRPHPPRPGRPQAAEDEAGAGRGTDVIVSGEPNPRADESACSSYRLRCTFQGIRGVGRSGSRSCALGFIVRVHCGLPSRGTPAHQLPAPLHSSPQPSSIPRPGPSLPSSVHTGTGFAMQSRRASLASSRELPTDLVTGVAGGGGDGRPGEEAGKK